MRNFLCASLLLWTAVGQSAVLGKLNTRDHSITIHSEMSNLRYTVETKDGALVADKLSAVELKNRYPDIHESLRAGLAAGAVNDASVRPEYLHPTEEK